MYGRPPSPPSPHCIECLLRGVVHINLNVIIIIIIIVIIIIGCYYNSNCCSSMTYGSFFFFLNNRRKLRSDVSNAFPSLSQDELSEIIPNKEEITVMRIMTHSGQNVTVYCLNGEPMFFEIEKRVIPTGSTLYKHSVYFIINYEKKSNGWLHLKILPTITMFNIFQLDIFSHFGISSSVSKVRTTLYSIINSTTGKYCSVAFI